MPADTDTFHTRWRAFLDAQVWTLLKAEVPLRVRWTGRERIACISVLGHGPDEERGVCFYDDVDMFDAWWSGAPHRLDGVSVLRGEADAPLVLKLVDSEPLAPGPEDLALASEVLAVVLGETSPVLSLARAEDEH